MASILSSFSRKHLPATLKEFYDFLEAAPSLLNARNTLTTAAGSQNLPVTARAVDLVTGGTAGVENVAMPAPATDGEPGWRVLVKLKTRTNAADSVSMAFANLSSGALTISAVTFDAAGEWLLLEHRGATWEVIAASAGVVTAA